MVARNNREKPGKQLSENNLEMIAERFRVLGDPLRLALLNHLRAGERSVGQLVDLTGATQANVSKHLQILFKSGVVQRRKQGLQVFYEVADPSIFDMCEIVCGSLDSQLEKELRAFRGDGRPPAA